jgi:hypothetical protein
LSSSSVTSMIAPWLPKVISAVCSCALGIANHVAQIAAGRQLDIQLVAASASGNRMNSISTFVLSCR